nr:MAG TPA: hypothetical protein [Caudoviricetes sp.]
MTRRKPPAGRYDAIKAMVDARELCDLAVGMAMNLAVSDDHGVYSDAARYDMGRIKETIVRIEAELELAPRMTARAA